MTLYHEILDLAGLIFSLALLGVATWACHREEYAIAAYFVSMATFISVQVQP